MTGPSSDNLPEVKLITRTVLPDDYNVSLGAFGGWTRLKHISAYQALTSSSPRQDDDVPTCTMVNGL